MRWQVELYEVLREGAPVAARQPFDLTTETRDKDGAKAAAKEHLEQQGYELRSLSHKAGPLGTLVAVVRKPQR